MKEREKYIIISGEAIKVTPEVYEVYYWAERKERLNQAIAVLSAEVKIFYQNIYQGKGR